MRLLKIAAGALALTACDPVTSASDAPPLPPEAEDTCDATDYAGLIGTPAAAVTLPADLPHRIYPEDGIVTQEYRPERLNVVTDGAGTVSRLWCG